MLRPRRTPAPRSRLPRVAAWSGAVAVLAVAAILPTWWLRAREFDRVVRRALELQDARGEGETALDVLDRWERETARAWDSRRDLFVRHVLNTRSFDDERVRRLLTRLTGADYRERLDDWRRWQADQARGRSAAQPREAVALERLWSAPVGITSWFSGVVAVDGVVYVASNGRAFDDPHDAFDGVVRVDGRSGDAEFIFEPRERSPDDVVGIAAGDGVLFVACRNGMLYGIRPDGSAAWRTAIGARAASAPLALDLDRDGTTDAAVVTEAGRLVACSGRDGRMIWVAGVPAPALASLYPPLRRVAPAPPLAAALAAADLTGDARAEIVVVSADGTLRAFAAANGREIARLSGGRGGVAGALVVRERGGGGTTLWVGDLAGRVLALRREGRTFRPLADHSLAARRGDGVVAAPRTATLDARAAAGIVVCLAGVAGEADGAVCLLTEDGLVWRCPIEGVIWGAPAVADVNGDGRPEIIVASSVRARDGGESGRLTIVSSGGHVLRREVLEAAVHAPPVVADVNGDVTLEILVADRSGRLHCFATGRLGPVEWGQAGGDVRNTRDASNAYSYGQAPHGYQWRWRPE